jgi:FkbH-like protein
MSSSTSLSGLIVSSFNAGNFSRYLEASEDPPRVTAASTPFGQAMQSLLNLSTETRPDFSIVWCPLEHISSAYAKGVANDVVSIDELVADVDAYVAALCKHANSVSCLLVPTWTRFDHRTGSILLRMRDPGGSARLLMEMNVRLAAGLEGCPNAYVLDAQPWFEAGGSRAREPKLWYLAKVPFGNEVFMAAARDVKACLRAVQGRSRKLIVLDLDDTLWGGIVGDTGWEKLRLGGHDAAGEAFVDFQQTLKALQRQGVILGIVSKNDENVALEAIDRHPEMVLRRSDFAGWRINWGDKARNLVELVHDLNLGLESVVFIDDSSVERARVREALPEVLVPDWPADPMLYPTALAGLRCFEQAAVTVEDHTRAGMYASERLRQELLTRIGSADEWLRSLGLHVVVDGVSDENFDRTLQLLNKTNQMNLATRRFDPAALREWLDGPGRRMWCFRVSDRLGDSGLTGLLSIEVFGGVAEIRDFVLSCRVMGRKIEETMLHVAVEYARAAGLSRIGATFIPTSRNRPCLEFLERARFPERPSRERFEWPTRREYPLPSEIELSRADSRWPA